MATNNASNQRKPVGVAEGGTGASTLTNHGVLLGQTTAAIAATSAGTANQVLQSAGAAADPAWSTATYPATTAQGDVLYSSSANTIAGLTKDANATRYVSNTGASNNPAWAQIDLTNGVTGVLPIANGGTNASSMATTYGVNYFDGTRLVTTAVGTATHVLTSNGVGVAPTFQAAAGGGISTLAGDSGTATGGTVTIAGTTNQITTSAASATVTLALATNPTVSGSWTTTAGYLKLPTTTSTAGGIQINGTTVYHSYGTNNQFWGASAGNYTLTTGSAVKNVSLGDSALVGLTTAAHSVAIGYNALNAHTVGDGCIAIGSGAADSVAQAAGTIAIGHDALTALTSINTTNEAYGNIAIGYRAAYQMTTGRRNVVIGPSAGGNWTGSEDSNICIVNAGGGGENHVIRIGTDGGGDGEQEACYIAGIYNHGSVNNTSAWPSMRSDGLITCSGSTAYTYQTTINLRSESGTAATGTNLNYQRSNAGSTITTGYTLGKITFTGHDGTGYIDSAKIISVNSGTIDTNRIASNLEFYTHPDSTTASTLRMTIASTGAVTIAAPDSGTGLTVSGGGVTVTAGGATITAGNFTVTNGDTTLVTTFAKTVGVSGIPVLVDNTGLLGTVASSERFKEEIEDMEDESSPIMDLRPVTFCYKKDQTGTMQYGLIAEEVYDIMPELVALDDSGIPYSVKYHDLPALLLNELQKLASRVEDLEKKLAKATKKGKE